MDNGSKVRKYPVSRNFLGENDATDQRTMVRLLHANRKATVRTGSPKLDMIRLEKKLYLV